MPRILGIDPGSRLTGFGVLDHHEGRLVYVTSGVIRVAEGSLADRLKTIHEGVTAVVEQFLPDELAIENVFMQRNADSALKLGQARGAAICAVAIQAIPVHEYTPAEIKQAIVGKGNAAKQQVQHMVRVLLTLPQAPQADAADALACAICHVHRQQSARRLATAAAAGLGGWR